MTSFSDDIDQVEFTLADGQTVNLASFCANGDGRDLRDIARAVLTLEDTARLHRVKGGKLLFPSDDQRYFVLKNLLSEKLRSHSLSFEDESQKFQLACSSLFGKRDLRGDVSRWDGLDPRERELVLERIASDFERSFGLGNKKINVVDITDLSPPFAEGFLDNGKYNIRRTAFIGSFDKAFAALIDAFSDTVIDHEKMNEADLRNIVNSDSPIPEDDMRSVLLTLSQDYLAIPSDQMEPHKTNHSYKGQHNVFVYRARGSVGKALKVNKGHGYSMAPLENKTLVVRSLNEYAGHLLDVPERVETPFFTALGDAAGLVSGLDDQDLWNLSDEVKVRILSAIYDLPFEEREPYKKLALSIYTHWRIHPEHLDELWSLQDRIVDTLRADPAFMDGMISTGAQHRDMSFNHLNRLTDVFAQHAKYPQGFALKRPSWTTENEARRDDGIILGGRCDDAENAVINEHDGGSEEESGPLIYPLSRVEIGSHELLHSLSIQLAQEINANPHIMSPAARRLAQAVFFVVADPVNFYSGMEEDYATYRMQYEERHASAFAESLTMRLAETDPDDWNDVDILAQKLFYEVADGNDLNAEGNGLHV